MAPKTQCTPPKRGLLTQIAPSHFCRQRFIPNKHIILQIGLQVEKSPSPVLGSNGSHNATALPGRRRMTSEGSQRHSYSTPGPPAASGSPLTLLRSALIPLDDSSMLKDVRSCLLVPEGQGRRTGRDPRHSENTDIP